MCKLYKIYYGLIKINNFEIKIFIKHLKLVRKNKYTYSQFANFSIYVCILVKL